jgi:hypothetical protein
MKSRILVAVAFLSIAVSARAQRRGAVDWIFLVDTSSSMRGIFEDVKASIGTFVSEASDGDSVSIYTFDRGVRMHSAMDIKGTARDDLRAIVNGLEPEEKRTHLGATIAEGLKRAEFLRAHSDPTRVRSIVLFTDGKEDVRGIEHPVPIGSNVDRVGDSFVFFVSMGEHEPQLDEFASATPHTTVLKAPNRESITRVAHDIRAQLPEPPPPPPPNLGPKPPVVHPPPPPPPAPPSPLKRALLILIPLAIAIGVALVLLQRHKQNNQLEGELEILQPRLGSDAAFVGLPRLQKSEIALSAIVPVDALAGSDARLFVRRTKGAKKVWIAAQSGSLRINDVETPTSELYDADTIQIGDAKLRFNRLGHERTVNTSEEDL